MPPKKIKTSPGTSKLPMICKPRQPPYLKDLQKMARDANIPNYGKMRKEELCEALGLIEKAGPYIKKTIAKRSPKVEKEIPEITKRIDAYVKKHKLAPRSVKENFKPPPDMGDYYYLWATSGKGIKIRNYAVP